MTKTAMRLAVILERRELINPWASSQWEVVGVLPDPAAEAVSRRIYADGRREQWLHSGLILELFRDETEFYYANITSPEPRVFVLWRQEGELPHPALLTVSYGLAARLMDAGEQVEGVPMPPDILAWVADFVRSHYRPAAERKDGRYATSKWGPAAGSGHNG